jgi:hypothetical protein
VRSEKDFGLSPTLGRIPTGYCSAMPGRDTLPELLSMNYCTNTYGHATDNFQLINQKKAAHRFRWGVHRVASRWIKILARWAAIWVLVLGAWVPVEGGCLKPDVNYSNYNTPLYDQILDRIKAKVLARLQEGNSRIDRYFFIPFAYQNRGNDPEFSHSFLSVIHVLAVGKHASTEGGLRNGKSHGREFEAFTISWLPHDFDTNPHLCVFEGSGGRIFASLNKCPISPGKSFNLESTLKLAVSHRADVGMWGPYEIRKEGFDLAVKRKKLLDKGSIRYRADDRLYRKDLIAINCFHAIAGLEELYPNGGLFGTGFKMWGINGTKRVLIEYTNRESVRGVLLEPVNYKKDLLGFVWAPERNARWIYNPFRNASAYHD